MKAQEVLFSIRGSYGARTSETIKINASYVDVGDFKINTVVIWRLVGCSRRFCLPDDDRWRS